MRSMQGLVDGVRALETLARFAPLSIPDFASAAALSPSKAERLIEAFSQEGYVRRVSEGEMYILTPLALALVPAERARGSGRVLPPPC